MSIFEKDLEQKSFKHKICIDQRDSFIDMAFDGCFYYFPSAHCRKIVKYNRRFKKVCSKRTFMKFNSICYDSKLDCFWATTQCCYKKIFKLDACLNPCGCICIQDNLLAGFISGISYDCCNDKLVVSYSHAIYSVDKTTGDTELLYENDDICITGVLSLCPGLVITYIEDGKQYILFYIDSATAPVVYDVPYRNLVQSIVYNPCNKFPCPTLDVFYYNCHCCPYVVKIPLNFLSINFTPDSCNECVCKQCPHHEHCCGCGCDCCRCCDCDC